MTSPSQPSVLLDHPLWLVIDKPAGWHSVRVRESDGAPTVEAWLAEERPEQALLPESGLVQRLDLWTSGCLLAGRTPEAIATLRSRLSCPAADAGQTGESGIGKRYLALVTPGIAEAGDWSLHFTSRHRGSSKVTVGRRGEESSRGRCRWRVLRRADAGAWAPRVAEPASKASRALHPGTATRRHAASLPEGFDLIEVDLIGPGRRHQIRAGFAFAGHALAGDDLYGGAHLAVEGFDEPWTDRPALHAARLVIDGQTIDAGPPSWLPKSTNAAIA